ncbi:probable WD repeat, SAM and U-box domain-containing protein 1 at C-terminar half [Coccomyxa sp. Obi]|nr:probable WD repeat, SAM and U-box domain-containing protein 1 at C-terminar half [Coccomyxa sp. Obi]
MKHGSPIPSNLLDAQHQQQSAFCAYEFAVKRAQDVESKNIDIWSKIIEVLASLKEVSGGAEGLYTVQHAGGHLDLPARLDAFDILAKGEVRAQEFRAMVKKHTESMPKRALGTFVEAGDIQAALMGLSPIVDRVPRMVAYYCSFYESATAEVLAMETAFLADTPVLQHIYTALIAQVAKERDENMRKLLEEEESQQQQTAAIKSSKRRRKARGGKAIRAKNTEACGKVQSDQSETHCASDDRSMVDSGLAHKDAAKPSDLGAVPTVEPIYHASEGDGNVVTLGTDNAIVALLKKKSLSCPDQKPSTGVRQPFKEGSRVQQIYSGLGGGLAVGDFLRQLCCPITEDIMQDAVIASDGVSYERSAIEGQLQQSSDPMLSLLSRQLLPNRTLNDIIEHFRVD